MSMSELNGREQTLVALGAAVGSNCVPCVEYHVPEARKAGCSALQIKEAIEIADRVRRVPAGQVLRTALARIEEVASGVSEGATARCGCAAPGRSGGVG